MRMTGWLEWVSGGLCEVGRRSAAAMRCGCCLKNTSPPVRALTFLRRRRFFSGCSVVKALKHSAIATSRDLDIVWIDASDLEPAAAADRPAAAAAAWARLRSASGVLVPGGFGDRGVEGKIAAVAYAREARVPLLGICLGLQVRDGLAGAGRADQPLQAM